MPHHSQAGAISPLLYVRLRVRARAHAGIDQTVPSLAFTRTYLEDNASIQAQSRFGGLIHPTGPLDNRAPFLPDQQYLLIPTQYLPDNSPAGLSWLSFVFERGLVPPVPTEAHAKRGVFLQRHFAEEYVPGEPL